MRTTTSAALAGAALLMAGCAGAEGLGDVLGGVLGGPQPASGNVGNLVAEVQQVDTRNQQLVVRTQDGQQGAILFDNQTRVVYQQQEYAVTALERGDVVEMQVQEVQQGYYTNYILVRQSVQERQGGGSGQGQLVQASGQISQLNTSRGWFDLQTQRGVVTVTLPYNPPQQTVSQFERLRVGDSVSLEGYLVADDRIELTRFR